MAHAINIRPYSSESGKTMRGSLLCCLSKALFMLALLLSTSAMTTAQVMTDTLSIRFALDSININMDFEGNSQRWQAFEREFMQRFSHLPAASLQLDIYAGASPEGNAAHNSWLGENRGQSIKRLVRRRLGQQVGNIIVHNEGARWDALYESVARSNEPWREEVMTIIELPPSNDQNQRDHREVKLRSLRDGTVWPVLLTKYLAPLRSGASAILTWVGGRDTVVIRETIITRDTLYIVSTGQRDTLRPDTLPAQPVKVQKPVVRRPAWILRSNLPLLGIGSPNLQAEWSIDHRDRWSLNLELIGPWWTFGKNAYANELLYGSVELRHWLGRRRNHHTLEGFHIGLGVGGGYYDLEWKSKGYQGEAVMGYLNIGWQHRFGKRRQWAFDAGIGLGYLYSPYRRYLGSSIFPESHTERYDDHLMWQYSDRLNWIGTPHANISIGYVFTPRKGLYRRSKAMERDAKRTAIEQERFAVRERERQQRDSLYLQWYDMPRKERKAARKAYKKERKAERQEEKTKQKRKRK